MNVGLVRNDDRKLEVDECPIAAGFRVNQQCIEVLSLEKITGRVEKDDFDIEQIFMDISEKLTVVRNAHSELMVKTR